MTAGWTGTGLAAGDVAWDAWYRLGVEPFALAFGGPVPEILEDLDQAIAPAVDRLTRQVLDEIDVRLYGEARERVVADVHRAVVAGVVSDVVGAVRSELTRPEPEPFAPPPAGAWIRGRWRRTMEWAGMWHAFTGDVELSPARLGHAINDRHGRTRCGIRMTLRSEVQDAAVAETMPTVDACRSCRRGDESP